MSRLRQAWDWLLGRDAPRPPDPDRTVEAAWVPLWQSRMICDELNAEGIPAVVTDDYGLNPMMSTREPMARIFVTEDRRDDARHLVEEILGHAPRHRPL